MKLRKGQLMTAVLMALAVLAISAANAENIIPQGTVIPVTMDKLMTSATARVGTTFYAHHNGVNGAGFPEDTEFVGKVESVTRASGKTAGQIDVGFVSAVLPGGTRVPIQGELTSLDDKSVQIDQSTGRLVGTSEGNKNRTKFIAIGAGAGLIVGQLAGKHAAIGAILGAAAGYLYNQQQAKAAVGRNVQVPAGTRFGILLAQDVTIPSPRSAAMPSSSGAGPNSGSGWRITFDKLQPVMRGNELMVPFRSVMDSIQMPFDYDRATKQITVSYEGSRTMHTVGTRTVNVDGTNTRLDIASGIINGAIYVPASFVELLTGRTAYWNHKTGVLRLE